LYDAREKARNERPKEGRRIEGESRVLPHNPSASTPRAEQALRGPDRSF
jgi:hypothetical protein